MGVTRLWKILEELGEKKHIKYLRGKKVAVDLSGWVVQAFKNEDLKGQKNPHIRNLFLRVSELLLNDVRPIFVLEGKVPGVKQKLRKELCKNMQKKNYASRQRRLHKQKFKNYASRQQLDVNLRQCQELLESLGVPCIKSSFEAEALCALLNAKGIVDGVITEDSDAFPYGANTVYRNFSIDEEDPHIYLYPLESEKNELKLNRRNLIALALLLGCDYCEGVRSIGIKKAVDFLKEFKGDDLLQRFKDWKQKKKPELFPGYEDDMERKRKKAHCERCKHLGSTQKHEREGCSMCDSEITCCLDDSENPCTCAWDKNKYIMQKHKHEHKVYNAAIKNPDFPNEEVIKEFMMEKYEDNPGKDDFDWKCPDLKEIKKKLNRFLDWTAEDIFKKCFPIITSWQQFKMSGNCLTDTLLYKPIKVLDKVEGENYLIVQWMSVDHDRSSDVNEEDLRTREFEDRFKKLYPEIVEKFYESKNRSESQPNSKKTAKGQETRKYANCVSDEEFSDMVCNRLQTKLSTQATFGKIDEVIRNSAAITNELTNTVGEKSEKVHNEESRKNEKRTLEKDTDDYELKCKKKRLEL